MESFLSPEEVIKVFDLEKGDHVVDFGAGHGFFAIPMAKAVGAKGKVYAIDIQKAVLEVIRSKSKREHLLNIEPVRADLDHPHSLPIRNGFIDFALIANTLFQTENPTGLLKEAYRLLCFRGRLAIIEWEKNIPEFLGPASGLRVDKEKLKETCGGMGFKFIKEFEAGKYHYGLLFRKKS